MTGLFGFTPIDTYATNILTVPRTVKELFSPTAKIPKHKKILKLRNGTTCLEKRWTITPFLLNMVYGHALFTKPGVLRRISRPCTLIRPVQDCQNFQSNVLRFPQNHLFVLCFCILAILQYSFLIY